MDNNQGFLDTWQVKKQSIAIIAGVFDPVHKGHITAAHEALRHAGHVVFVAERKPWRKNGIADYKHRLAMLKIAAKNEPHISAADYPGLRFEIVPFFNWIKTQFPGRKILWFVDLDDIKNLHNWDGVDQLSQLGVAEILTLRRKNAAGVYGDYIESSIDMPIRKMPRTAASRRHEHISSSWVKEGFSHRHTALPIGVYDYIRQYNLYN